MDRTGIARPSAQGLGNTYGPPFERYLGYILGEVGPVKVPHEEEWVEGSPRAIWVEFK